VQRKLGLLIVLLAALLLFLKAPAFTASSHEAVFITGQNIFCDGGMKM